MWQMLREWRRRRLWRNRPTSLQIFDPNGTRTVRIIGTEGVCLRVFEECGERLVTQTMAVNHAEFWHAWRTWSGDPVLRLPDGRRYTPWK